MKHVIKRPLLPWEARRLGVSWVHALGRKDNPNAGRELVLTNQILPIKRLESLVISRRFNLGNHIRQVANAVRFAELRGFPAVYLPGGSIFSPGLLGPVQLASSESIGQPTITGAIYGDFFYYQRYGLSDEKLERARVTKALRPHVPLLRDSVRIPKLGIHLRAGDTFTDRPHPLYMPPPLRFFLEAVDQSQVARDCGVHLVCQDLSHPYIEAIKDHCLQQGIACRISSSSLDEDFKALASFEELCLSQGTLALAAAWLSNHCKRIYAFQREAGELSTSQELGIEICHATARESLGPWTASGEQIQRLASPLSIQLDWQSTGSLA